MKVPTALAIFPNELFTEMTEVFAGYKYHNIIMHTHHLKGGHFPAMEVPDILAEDIRQFVKKNEDIQCTPK